MGISKYPRFGQRIAPSILRDILAAPTPSGILPNSNGGYAQLADLDEKVWQSASPNDCKLLGNYVIHEVKQNLRQLPRMLEFNTLSLIARKIPLCELELELRTFNALKKRFGQNIPPETLIRDLLNIAGFGIRGLVDFLVAVEFFGSRPHESEQLNLAVQVEIAADLSPEELPSKIEAEISHYPRPGHRIAPMALKSILNIPVNDRRLAHTLLCDLDESAWDSYSPELCRKLALAVVNRARICRIIFSKEAGRIKMPMPKTNGKPIVLQLEQRTFNCLHSRGFLDNPIRLAQMTIADFVGMSNFGVKSLVDLLSSLETQVSGTYTANAGVLDIAQRLSRLKEADELRIDDPRFGLALQALRIQGKTLQEICEVILAGIPCPMPAKVFARRLEDLLGRLRAARRIKLEDELIEILAFDTKARNREYTVKLLGWDGNGGLTLEAIGRISGITRERVRQIAKRHLEYIHGKRPFLPILERIIEVIAENTPCSEIRISNLLLEKRLTNGAFKISGVFSAAEATGRKCPFIIEEGDGQSYIVPRDAATVVKQILQLARKAISHWGVTTIEDVAAEASTFLGKPIANEFVSAVVSAQPSFGWLDAASGWFWIKSTSRNALLNQIEKILSVCQRIHVTELRSGVSRNHRREGFAPPQRVLLALCAQAGGYKVDGNFISAAPPLDYTSILADSEKTFVAVFRKNGPLLEVHKLEAECLRQRMNQATFGMNLVNSPIISRFARCVYGLRGTEVSPGQAESLAIERRKTRVLSDYGWTQDGKIFLSYILSSGTLVNGIVSVPTGMKEHLSGAYELRVAEGASIGRLVVKDSQAWGLGPLFRRRGGDPGDSLRIEFDLKTKIAVAELGQASVDEDDEVSQQLVK